MTTVLILGSAPMAAEAARWPRAPFDRIVAINNAHAIRPDWDFHIHPWDFPTERRPAPGPGQQIVTQEDFVPAQNALGGFVYAGGTMAFTAIYWALHALSPRVIAVFGCDMHYPATGPTHFYGQGAADPLRPDVTLRSLEAKSARLMVLAARRGTAMVNLSQGPSRLVFPRLPRPLAPRAHPAPVDERLAARALEMEQALDYRVPSGRYWEESHRFDAQEIDRLDALWLAAARPALVRRAARP
ncbi:hypothetical protein LHP98_04265 [Rhodobacter sp. Har01]|uniref:hypothetical protein n=1 Tax=Rhodobacter sp. Har01 TaxID=2883999 RepID=UPI001D0650AA|nr:hypothetical protein [Rhodobacter sp. Har01]MCB6177342.1 hypothetical protein [Rhodobacter sp. Har01]